ncbi:MAG: acyl carrier protein [Burkholderiales bacterium]|nr:acyl carrier protein [Burkholderiales bacterium]MDE2277089.1 acyl carrier protein [Burkholderiales bacterium]
MPSSTFDTVASVLHTQFNVPREQLTPQTTLPALGLDSLALMEFVFAVEDRFSLRIPEERLDPRQAELTLADVCAALDEGLAARVPAAA